MSLEINNKNKSDPMRVVEKIFMAGHHALEKPEDLILLIEASDDRVLGFVSKFVGGSGSDEEVQALKDTATTLRNHPRG